VRATTTLSERTTLRVGGPARGWVIAETEQQVIDAVRECDARGEPILVLGGGSNVLVADNGFPGTVLSIATRGIAVADEAGSVVLTVHAGESWDDVVALSVERGWCGIEALSGIPGLSGATPVQNVGAYGQEISQVVTSVRVLDRTSGRVERLDRGACGFAYRASAFKAQPERWVVLSMTVRLDIDPTGAVRYAELAHELGVEVGAKAAVGAIRTAVLLLRGRKGMVLDESDPDTWSAGSFFTNPVVDDVVARSVPAQCPRYPAGEGVKLSAAWLIEQAGVARGHRARPDSGARVSGKHTLALTNTGTATAADLLELAADIRERVRARFGIILQPEVRLVGCSL
jgi:UDP-N-acetylmuramate dehydrogenase